MILFFIIISALTLTLARGRRQILPEVRRLYCMSVAAETLHPDPNYTPCECSRKMQNDVTWEIGSVFFQNGLPLDTVLVSIQGLM
jgi:hypothetical protein